MEHPALGPALERGHNRRADDLNRLRGAVGVHDVEGHIRAVVAAGDDRHLRAARLREDDQPVRMRAHALVPDHLVRVIAKDLGLLKVRVARRVANHQGTVPGESLDDDAGKLADRGATRQLADERRRAAAGIARKLLGDVLTIVAGHDPRQRVGIAVLIEDAAILEGDHADAPRVPG